MHGLLKVLATGVLLTPLSGGLLLDGPAVHRANAPEELLIGDGTGSATILQAVPLT